jgi:hypothetical protein
MADKHAYYGNLAPDVDHFQFDNSWIGGYINNVSIANLEN